MGIYDRDYIKDEFDEGARGRRFHAWQALIGINVVVWILWLVASGRGGGSGQLLQQFISARSTRFRDGPSGPAGA